MAKINRILLLKISIIVLLFLCKFSTAKAAWYYDKLDMKENITIKYKWKTNKEGKTELRIKFKNKSKSAVNLDTEIGFYTKGILEESARINVCLKKSCFNNWFRPVQIINSGLNNEQLNSEDLKLEVTEFKTEKVDECRETDS